MRRKNDAAQAQTRSARARSGSAPRDTPKRNRTAGRVGQVGLGIMGGAFATHLRAAGYDVAGYDPDSTRASHLRTVGGTVERSIAAVAQRCTVIITSLPSVVAVEN